MASVFAGKAVEESQSRTHGKPQDFLMPLLDCLDALFQSPAENLLPKTAQLNPVEACCAFKRLFHDDDWTLIQAQTQ